ncbi:glucan endo-1,3-beta-glucosidase 8-like [Diospyros lotus]|uniref:glucan endo-1,3-beta-glucosidase 8-like n=1 Tax=Diospyros lotus TaxID=55363 RepID=UPI0022546842|nr:glucan endo-1,3-beta-glucosidase 8-like [Diospyros lotus]
MARASAILLWVCSTVFLLAAATNVVEALGVNWGSQCTHPLPPDIVVQMLKDNGVHKVKLFDADPWIVRAFAGTGIEVVVGIPNEALDKISKDYDKAVDWVKRNITKHMYDGGVNIKMVAVGNEPFLTSYNGSYVKTTLPAMKNVQRALKEAGHSQIKVTTPMNADVYHSSSGLPSNGDFRADVKSEMVDIVKWLDDQNSFFLVNIYPFLSLYQNKHFPIEYAFFDGRSKPIVDKGNAYENMFDANLDTLAWSMAKAGAPNLGIMVGEAGWPTDGDINANVSMAERFYQGFLKKMAANKGTPLRPGHLEVYLFALMDEDQKSVAPGGFERHWGIFRYDGQPKFPIDFTGQGREKMPIGAKNVQYQEKKWCVFNRDVKIMNFTGRNVEYACAYSDCTALVYGSSCNKLDLIGNISYAFNMYFQMNDQDVEACVFEGLATITTVNASTGSCLFPIQIQSGGIRLHAHLSVASASFFGLIVLFFLLALV